MPGGVKREAPDGVASSAGPSATRVKTEQDDNDDTGNGNNNDDETQDEKFASILERLDTLEFENNRLRAEVKTLEAFVVFQPQLVEFKFCSCRTYHLEKNDWKGVLHVPMIQHPLTGVYNIPNGLTRARGTLQSEAWIGSKKNPFVATFERGKGQPIKTFNLGYSLQYSVGDRVNTQLTPSELTCTQLTPGFWGDLRKDSLYPYAPKKVAEFKTEDSAMLDHWEKNAGGILSVYAKGSFKFDPEYYEEQTGDDPNDVVHQAKYKIKLYTVLSAHKPNQISPIPPVPEGTTPDWDALERLVKSRHPQKEYKWVKRAVEQYVHFLQLKNEHNDFRSETFSPSIPIDMIWHAHLSFLDRYHRDVQALAGSTDVLEHSPVLGEDAKARYAAAHQAHVARMHRLDKPVYQEFWPYPERAGLKKEENDGDSDDHLCLPSHSSCG
jgi:hypothetical protein